QITQSGSSVRIHWETKDKLYAGVSFPVATDPTRNQIGFRRCGVTNDSTNTGEMGRARVIRRSLPEADEFLATSIFTNGNQVDTCSWEYERIATTDPGVHTCEGL